MTSSIRADSVFAPLPQTHFAQSAGVVGTRQGDTTVPAWCRSSAGLLTAALALGVLVYLNWQLTLAVVALVGVFLWGTTRAFGQVYPAFHGVSQLTAEITGRLAEALGGIRVVKTYVAERREEHVFARESHRLFRLFARALTGVSALTAGSTLITATVAEVGKAVASLARIHELRESHTRCSP